MKTSVLIGSIMLILSGCNQKHSDKSSYLKSVVDSLEIDSNNNILIYTINPHDCISCINGFKILNKSLTKSKNSKLYVISVDREIEKETIIESNPDLNFLPTQKKHVCWSKELFVSINQSVNYNNLLSLITVYNYKADSILFCKPIREIRSEIEVEKILIQK